jgi:hypothetical protein
MPADSHRPEADWRPPADGGPARVAIGLHEGAVDAAPHLDFFLGPAEPVADDARVVWSWRLRTEALEDGRIVPGSYEAEASDQHRALYLRLAEPRELGADRGRFTPLLRADARARLDGALSIETKSWRLRAEPAASAAGGASPPRWRFTFAELHS